MKNISVVIPCYNSSRTIEKVLVGLEKQNLSPLEVIVVDDCSTDDTGAIALRHKVKLITLEQNSGPAIARNRGANECKGDAILFLDSDAVPHNDLIANISNIYTKLSQEKFLAGVGGRGIEKMISSAADKWRARHASQNHGKKPLTNTSYLFGLCGSYLTEVFLALGGFDESFPKNSGEDLDLGIRLIKRGYTLYYDPSLKVDHLHQDTLLNLQNVQYNWTYWSLVSKQRNQIPLLRSLLGPTVNFLKQCFRDFLSFKSEYYELIPISYLVYKAKNQALVDFLQKKPPSFLLL